MKICTKCKIEKETTYFGLDNKQKDKLNMHCFDCRKAYRKENKEKITAYRKSRLHLTRIVKAEYDLIYRQENKEKIAGYKKKWENENKDNIIYKIKRNLRRRIHHAIKNNYKSDHTMTLLGCSVEEFLKYMESKFLPGMTWDNYGLGEGKWHVDHIRPCCDFDLSIPEEQQKCFHYSNMQPLWEKDNLKKSYIFNGKNCRLEGPTPPESSTPN